MSYIEVKQLSEESSSILLHRTFKTVCVLFYNTIHTLKSFTAPEISSFQKLEKNVKINFLKSHSLSEVTPNN